jgi:hypothetical protein
VIGFFAATALGDRRSLFVSCDGQAVRGTDNHQLLVELPLSW